MARPRKSKNLRLTYPERPEVVLARMPRRPRVKFLLAGLREG